MKPNLSQRLRFLHRILKKIDPLATLVALVLVCSALCITGVGCQAPADRIAVNAAGSIVITVDAGMKAWASYVNSGKATQKQVDTVKDFYQKYYTATILERDAIVAFEQSKTEANKSAWQNAASIAQASFGNLINVIMQYLPADKATALKKGTL